MFWALRGLFAMPVAGTYNIHGGIDTKIAEKDSKLMFAMNKFKNINSCKYNL